MNKLLIGGAVFGLVLGYSQVGQTQSDAVSGLAQQLDAALGNGSYVIKFKREVNIQFTNTTTREAPPSDIEAPKSVCFPQVAVFQGGKQLKSPYGKCAPGARCEGISAEAEGELSPKDPFCEVFYMAKGMPHSQTQHAFTSQECGREVSAEAMGTTIKAGQELDLKFSGNAMGAAPNVARRINNSAYIDAKTGRFDIAARLPGAVIGTSCYSDDGASAPFKGSDFIKVFGEGAIEVKLSAAGKNTDCPECRMISPDSTTFGKIQPVVPSKKDKGDSTSSSQGKGKGGRGKQAK